MFSLETSICCCARLFGWVKFHVVISENFRKFCHGSHVRVKLCFLLFIAFEVWAWLHGMFCNISIPDGLEELVCYTACFHAHIIWLVTCLLTTMGNEKFQETSSLKILISNNIKTLIQPKKQITFKLPTKKYFKSFIQLFYTTTINIKYDWIRLKYFMSIQQIINKLACQKCACVYACVLVHVVFL